ncbi:potassium channel protein [Candidatus Obscuribacterales bacterium]|nr:potassium channel protein [Candidatus Obscuribacterales bacterium]MBX3153262.1 potassium channel protein [Candidatus Obscuribacterales bacterium]
MEDPKLNRVLSHLFKMVALVGLGTAGFMIVEGWGLLDSLFMSVTTIATVGYGEVHPLTPAGQIFAIFLIFFGVGAFLYIASDMVSLALELRLGRNMNKQIVKLNNHQIICGFGRTGQEVASQFRINKIPFVIIELNSATALQAEEAGHLVIEGDASADEVLMRAQVEKAKGIVCALPDDTQNTFIALTARGLNDRIDVVSRAANPGSESKLKRVGARMVISPYVICGQRLAAAVTHPLVTQFLDVVMHTADGDLRMEQMILSDNSKLVGRTLKDANIKQESGAMILAVNQNGKLITNPTPDLKFCVGDELIALGAQGELNKLAKLAGRTEN